MDADYSRIWPVLVALLAIAMFYRRLRRNFGRQILRARRMRIRIAVLMLLAGLLLVGGLTLPTVRNALLLAAQVSGALAGTALGWWGANRTRFQTCEGRLCYIPHTYTGIFVTLLVVGRLAYRVAQVYGTDQTARITDGAPMTQTPLTSGLIFVIVGYYVCYYSLVLWKAKHISPEDPEVTATPSAAAST